MDNTLFSESDPEQKHGCPPCVTVILTNGVSAPPCSPIRSDRRPWCRMMAPAEPELEEETPTLLKLIGKKNSTLGIWDYFRFEVTDITCVAKLSSQSTASDTLSQSSSKRQQTTICYTI